MNTYDVTYKEYSNDKTIYVAAPTVMAAYKAARVWLKKKYMSSYEITSVIKRASIAIMGKD